MNAQLHAVSDEIKASQCLINVASSSLVTSLSYRGAHIPQLQLRKQIIKIAIGPHKNNNT